MPHAVVDAMPELRLAFVREFERQFARAIARRGRFIAAIPGGSVASEFFPPLSAAAVDWSLVEMFWVDERAVPPDHPDSNYGVAARLLLAPAGVPDARIHRMRGELPDLDDAARRASAELRSIAGDPPRLDLVLAGAGDDGHVASIFSAASPASSAVAPPVIAVYDSPKPPPRRLTLTLPVLAAAEQVVVAAFGRSKAAVMRGALENRATTPVAELLRASPASLVLLDREAGQLS
jgi:6-phosphogluconolactonase